jgi:hypothetical protein
MKTPQPSLIAVMLLLLPTTLIGYVKDDDAKDINYDDMLPGLQKS